MGYFHWWRYNTASGNKQSDGADGDRGRDDSVKMDGSRR